MTDKLTHGVVGKEFIDRHPHVVHPRPVGSAALSHEVTTSGEEIVEAPISSPDNPETADAENHAFGVRWVAAKLQRAKDILFE
jgi:hypothetical protein